MDSIRFKIGWRFASVLCSSNTERKVLGTMPLLVVDNDCDESLVSSQRTGRRIDECAKHWG
jgi:hypothetical protein